MNGLNDFDKTDREHSSAPTVELIKFQRSKVKGQGHNRRRGSEGIYVDAGVEFNLLICDYEKNVTLTK